MTNTTSPAETLSASSAAAAFYRWEVPDKPVTVYVSLDVVERLEREAIESFKAITKRGSEIGGVLCGRVIADRKRSVYIERIEPVECEYSRGPLYMFGDEDRLRLKEAIGGVRSGTTSAVGFYRSNTRSSLAFDEEDLALAKEYFADPSNVFLLVRPYSMKPSLGGLFFWENGSIEPETYLKFPFRKSELLDNFSQFIISNPEPASVMPAREPVMMPKREERPPVTAPRPVTPARRDEPSPVSFRREEPKPALVPPKREDSRPAVVAPKREEPAPVSFKREERPLPSTLKASPLGLKTPPPPAVPKREERPTVVAKEPPKEAAVPAAKKDERPPMVAAPKRDEKPAAPAREDTPAITVREEKPAITVREEKPAVTVKTEEKPAAPAALARPPEPKKEETVIAKPAVEQPAAGSVDFALPAEPAGFFARFKWVILGILLIAIAAGGFFLFRGKSGAETAAVPTDTTLGLKVERNAGQLILSWNRNAPLLATANRAILTITDGDHKEDIDLDLGQLRSGSIVYSPITNDVSFRLEVTDLKNGKTLSESQRFLAGRPSPAVAAMQTPAAKATAESTTPNAAAQQPAPAAPETQTPAAAQPAAQPATEQPKVVAGPAVTAQPPKPESLAARLRAPEPQELPAPPTIDTSSALPQRAAIPVQTPTAAPPSAPPPPPQQQAAAPQPAATQGSAAPVRTGGRAQEARLLQRVSPVYPVLARQSRVSGIVRVQALIGRNGKVKKATAISGPPLLRQAAVDAVLRWTYSPAQLNGEPVEADTFVDINFQL